MRKFFVFTVQFSRILNIVGGAILVLMMLLTVRRRGAPLSR